ncbi:hypothetical protein AMJ49_04120 [Parcubacteria bacterium DG_74_2]|nr:MAG: hypothetical protein AMJ49_04120 [Parcubacteria bacterium DG_74_2]
MFYDIMLSKIINFVKTRREILTRLAIIKFSFRKFLSKFFSGVKKNQEDIILVIGVILISLLSFSVGYITAKHQEKIPLKIQHQIICPKV